MKRFVLIVSCWVACLAVGLSACINDDASGGEGCPTSNHYLVVRSFDADGKELTGTGVVGEVVLYLFDSNRRYFESVVCQENEHVPLYYPEQLQITVVGWGNSAAGDQSMPELVVGMSLDDARVTLKRAANELHPEASHSPGDLFLGTIDITLTSSEDRGEVGHELFVNRKVASMHILVRGLQQWVGTQDKDFSFVVSGSRESVDFKGKTLGGEAYYTPQPMWLDGGLFSSGIFNTLPSQGHRVRIDIYKGAEKIYTVAADQQGDPFNLAEGRLLQVLIDFAGEIRIGCRVCDWGEIDINQEF